MLEKDFYIKNGFIYGLVNIIYLMITYVMGVNVMLSWFNIGLSIFIGLGMMSYMGLQVRTALGGYMKIGEGFKSIMVIYALGAFLYLLFNHVLATVIDPELPGKLATATIDKTMNMMESFGVADDQLDQTYEELSTEIKESMSKAYTIGGFIQNYVTTLVFGSIGALIGAAITKKENPNPFAEDQNTSDE